MISLRKILKAIMPYGLVYLYFKQKKKSANVYTSEYTFQIDFVTGWIEPAHVKLELDIKDWIQKNIFYNGMYEKDTVKKLYELLPQDGIFFDIGANIGVYSLNVFRKAKDVFAFEATKTTYDKLHKIIKENTITNIHLNFNAVDDTDAHEVSIFQGDAVLGSVNNGGNSMFSGSVVTNTVQTIRLDTFVENNRIPKIDIIKIDIEGNELYALKGGINSIRKFRPVIFCEINPELNLKAGYNGGDLYKFIVKDLKYEAKILLNGRFKSISKTQATSHQCNVFFFPL